MHNRFLGGAIDAVVTWVDGSDPAHKAKRQKFLGPDLHANGVNPHRWACADELSYCLRSIGNHAPWIRRIWIVTDAQQPDLSGLPDKLRAKIAIVDHQMLFYGLEHALPTFNSLAIESLIWRISGLAERFVYFNDDVFLTAPLSPDDVFHGAAPVLRGKWEDLETLIVDSTTRHDPALLNKHVTINAAAMVGFDATRIFCAAHVVHPMRRSIFSRLFAAHSDAFFENVGHRFRDIRQFLPQALHNHVCIVDGMAVLRTGQDFLHLRSGAVVDYPISEVRAYLERALRPETRFLCINDLPALEAKIPDTRDFIEAAIGGAARRAA